MSKIRVTKEQINAILLIEKKHLERFDHILSQNDDYEALKVQLKESTNIETNKFIHNEINHFKKIILPLRKKEREQIVKAISLLSQILKSYDDLPKLKKLVTKYSNHLDLMDAFKQKLYDDGHNVWS